MITIEDKGDRERKLEPNARLISAVSESGKPVPLTVDSDGALKVSGGGGGGNVTIDGPLGAQDTPDRVSVTIDESVVNGVGSPADAAVTDPLDDASLVALTKGLLARLEEQTKLQFGLDLFQTIKDEEVTTGGPYYCLRAITDVEIVSITYGVNGSGAANMAGVTLLAGQELTVVFSQVEIEGVANIYKHP